MLGGEDGTTYPAVGYDPDTYNVHQHTMNLSGGEVNGSIEKLYEGMGAGGIYSAWHHTATNVTCSSETLLPPGRSLKLLRYYGIPTVLPVDIIVPFNTDVPAGYSRYSDQDNYFIYCSDSVGVTVGASQHRHLISYNFNGSNYCLIGGSAGGSAVAPCNHSHVGSFYTSYANNAPPAYGTVLGKITTPQAVISQNALLLAGSSALLTSLTSLSAVGESLNGKLFVGKASYSDLGGSWSNDHDDIATTTAAATGSCLSRLSVSGLNESWSTCSHTHNLNVAFDPYSAAFSRIMPHVYRVDSQIDCSTFGNDLFYRYISPSGSMASPVNISLIKTYYPSFEGVCLADSSDNLHFLWAAQGLNTTKSNARISYKKMTSGSLGARVDLTTSDEHMLFPSMDIDKNSDIHTAWFNATTNQAIQYCKYSVGAFGAVENVDTSAYVGYPGNIITDRDCNVYLFYAKWTDPATAIKEIMFRKRTSLGWSAATNLSPNKASSGYNQYPGQCYIDNKGNAIVTWSGKGYGAHTSVYHPVYRYIALDGTIIPAVGSDATDIFPLDDTEIIYPTVFWHSYPVTDEVYQNLVVSGLTFMYLYNPRNGSSTKDKADLKFYSSSDALVGDVGSNGLGGVGDVGFNPGSIADESILQKDTYTVTLRGNICRSLMSQITSGNYIS
jgi:hypothetical protein